MLKQQGFKMKKEKDATYHIWEGEDLKAKAYANVELPDGGVLHQALVGEIEIKKGDALYLTHGSERQVYTRSGRGYESEFPYGRVTLHGVAAGVVLTAENGKFAKITTTPREDFDAQIETQKARVNPQIEELKDVFIFQEVERRQKAKEHAVIAEAKRKEKIQGALSQMEAFFGTPKKMKP